MGGVAGDVIRRRRGETTLKKRLTFPGRDASQLLSIAVCVKRANGSLPLSFLELPGKDGPFVSSSLSPSLWLPSLSPCFVRVGWRTFLASETTSVSRASRERV